MLRINKQFTIVLLCLLSGACSKVDDYMLGKDNTPQPKNLQPINAKVSLVEKWTAPSGGSKKSAVYSKLIPVISGNIIYSADNNGFVQAINKSTGVQLWSKKLPHNLISGPTLANGKLIVAASDASIQVLNQKDGADLWNAKVSSDVLSKPVYNKNKVIAKTIDGNLYAFDINSGKPLWKSEHGAPSLILKASSSPVVFGNLILVGYSDGKMDAVEPETGRILWQRSIAYATGSSDVERLVDIDADPIVKGDSALLGSYQGYVGALSLTNGEFTWRKPASIYKNMVLGGKTLYLTDSNDVIWAIDSQSGRVNWKQVALKARGLTEPTLMGDRLFVGDKTGMMHVLSIHDGQFLARVAMNGPVNVAPIAAGKNIYVITTNGKLSRYSVS